ncbi:AMP-dependent synthetase/ligase [Croceicoccus sp. F390]|uniref:AMP-dependent synthetase/ligase n=1 Tax=Croceicoccus esteveae TaxID=3075597 RepID=A0ABU2ZIP1_9SPHN|nr:AMP-dependent synthetase/ligase [Croceicoccus sp. F390]MDT0575444.1 AMP-dependent synthetase/ligase [Croceicoccus sp. F390]
MTLADIETASSLVALFLQRADLLTQQPFLVAKNNDRWVETSWNSAAQQICNLAENLLSLGLKTGDRVMLVSENRPEWCIADLAIMAAGLVTVPAYVTNTVADHLHILDDSGAAAVIVSTPALATIVIPAMLQAGNAKLLITMEDLGRQQAELSFHDFAQLCQGDAVAARAAVNRRIAAMHREDLACIIYTSGTGGAPRGVRQHHGAMLHNSAAAARIIAEDFGWRDERFLSFLPLSHAYEHTAGQMLPIGLGARIFYAEGLDRLARNMEEAAPTIMVVVPRLLEVLCSRIDKQVRAQGRIAGLLVDRAMARAKHASGKQSRGIVDRIEDMVMDRTIRPRVQARFGGKLKAIVSGGAPLNPDIGHFFSALGLPVLQGYGQTEAGPIISCNRPAAGLRMASVGPPLEAIDVRIAGDGEILVRGEPVMHGYWRNREDTRLALHDGWLHTGDIGLIDEAGRIVITDRKKDMIVNDKGDNISPSRVEGMLTIQPEIAQALVSGDRRPYLVALVVPDAEWTASWAAANGVSGDWPALTGNARFKTAVGAAIDRVNATLSVTEQVRNFAFADEQFSVANKELTPSLKLRRHKVRDRYGDRMAGLYSRKNFDGAAIALAICEPVSRASARNPMQVHALFRKASRQDVRPGIRRPRAGDHDT